MRVRLIVVVGLLCCGQQGTLRAAEQLEPSWTREFPQAIEWAAPVGAPATRALLVCTANAELTVIDADTGAARFARPVPAEAGVRLADGVVGDVAYCYDRFSAYALALSGPPAADRALLWQAGEWPLPAKRYRGDPEFLTRVVAGHATPLGLLVARSDGRVALLTRERGRVGWTLRLPKLAEGRLHARGAQAALLFKEHDAPKVAFFPLDRRPMEPTIRTLGDTRPIWSELVAGSRLVAVWPKRAVVSTPGGRLFALEPEDDDTFHAAGMGVYASNGAGSPAGRPECRALLLACYPARDGQTRLHAYDLSNGRIAWRAEAEARPEAVLTRLWLHEGVAITMTRHSLHAYDATTGDLIGRHGGAAAARLLGVTVAGECAYGLYRELALKDALERTAALVLVRVPLRRAAERLRVATRAADVTRFRLDSQAPPRQVLWCAGRLVLVEGSRLRAYTLP